MKISFVIPCYGSEHTLADVVSEIKSVMKLRPAVEYGIVLVCDHSPDNVAAVIERLCREDPSHLRGLLLSRNFGQHAALMAGYARADGDFVVSLDDDGQSPVEAIWELIDKMESSGLDVVYGSYAEKKHNVLRNLGSRVNDWMATWLLGKPRDIKVTSFFAARRYVMDEMLRYDQAFPYVIGLVFRITRSVANVPVRHRERASGRSGYSFSKLLGLWLNGFTSFSVKPLRIASWLGLACSFAGFCVGVWAVVNKLVIHPEAPMGYSSLMSAILFIGGLLLLVLGLIGEYVSRIYLCVSKTPQYVVAKEIP